MKTTFDNLMAFKEYMPRCIICGKDIQFVMTGFWNVINPKYSIQQGNIRIKFNIQDRYLKSIPTKKNAKNEIAITIDLESNQIIEGSQYLHSLKRGELHKICTTCHCKIKATFQNSEKEKFPILTLDREEIKYVLKGGKSLEITNSYRGWSGTIYSLSIEGKHLLSPVPIELSKFQDLKHLNKRLATILTFH